MLSKAIVSSYQTLVEFFLWVFVIAGGSIGAYVGKGGGLPGILIGGGFGLIVVYLGIAIFAGAVLILGDIRQSLLRIEKILEKQT